MGIENINQGEDASAGAAGETDLKDALAGDGGEGEFVSEGEAKKPSPLVVFGLILAVAGGGYLWYSNRGPAAADADAADADAASQTVSKFLDGGVANVQLMEKMLRDTEKVVQQFLNYPTINQVPLGELQTNPFRFRAPKTENGLPNESEAVAKKRREEERQAILKAVGNLNLQSVIHSGARKSCMINNTLYTEGEQVDDFTVERINPGTVIVKNGVYRFELRMQK